jgi:hypothetical protein
MREFISWLKRQEVERTKLELKAGSSYFCYKSRWERADSETFKKGLIYMCNKDGVLDNFIIKNPEQHFIEIKDERIAWLEKQGESYTKKDVDNAYIEGMACAKNELEKQSEQKVSYTTTVETGNGGINALVTRELSTNNYEQKTAEKIEPFDKYEGLTDFERTLADICIGWIGEEFGWKQYIKDNADVLLKIAVEKFNSVQDVPFEQNPATSYCQEHCKGYQETGKCFADGDCKDKRKAEQKSAWSEEDEKMCQETIDWFEKKCFPYALESENPARESIKWLKSLKYRVQPKQKWSEDDENTIKFLINHFCVSHCNRSFQFTSNKLITHDELLEKIRNLRPQPQWKPSDEQMDALRYVTNFDYGGYKAILVSLYEQLKKLREE